MHACRSTLEDPTLCSYTQTREYMKKVLEIYARYLYLYGKQDYLPAPTVDAGFVKDDLDY